MSYGFIGLEALTIGRNFSCLEDEMFSIIQVISMMFEICQQYVIYKLKNESLEVKRCNKYMRKQQSIQ